MRTMEGLRASSRDGRTFDLGTGTGLATPGDLLVAATGEGPVLVQAERETGGVVVGRVDDDGGAGHRGGGEVRGFADCELRSVTAEELTAFQRSTGAGLEIGSWRTGDAEVPAHLRASGFNRHTFLCGQSGSGKTYALGVVLEQLLLETELRMVVLDPNADFVHLSEPRADAGAAQARRIAGTDIRVLGARPPAEPLLMRFSTVPRPVQAAILRLDPLADRDEYNAFVTSSFNAPGSPPPSSVEEYVAQLLAGGPDQRALAQRIQNLGLGDWEVWARQDRSAAEIVASGVRATVLDLAGFDDPRESTAACLDLVESLWAARHDRRPLLLVVDEAHNLCPARPVDRVQELLVERLVQVAAEGRKYGLWLLLSTQRPSKVHPQVVSQCDNLMLMRMNSPADLADVAATFGFAPAQMVAVAPFFRQGEALMAGRFAPCPMQVRMGRRLTVEGGSDVSVPLPSGG